MLAQHFEPQGRCFTNFHYYTHDQNHSELLIFLWLTQAAYHRFVYYRRLKKVSTLKNVPMFYLIKESVHLNPLCFDLTAVVPALPGFPCCCCGSEVVQVGCQHGNTTAATKKGGQVDKMLCISQTAQTDFFCKHSQMIGKSTKCMK